MWSLSRKRWQFFLICLEAKIMATLIEKLVSFVIIGELAAIATMASMGVIGHAKITGAMLQVHQTAKQSRYDAIVNYGAIRSVAIYENGSIAECVNNVCGAPVRLPSGVEVTSTFRGLDARVAGRAGSERGTLISWASETNSGIGGSFGQHGTIHFRHPWTRKRFCLVRGGATGNEGSWSIRQNRECR